MDESKEPKAVNKHAINKSVKMGEPKEPKAEIHSM